MVEPNAPNETGRPDDVDPEGRPLPPYEGRRESAEVDPSTEAVREGARVGGATGPVENEQPASADPGSTPGGATGSPSDEQSAAEMPETDVDDDRVGPAHEAGTGRAENKP